MALSKNEQAVVMGYSRYRVNGQEYPDYTTANVICNRIAEKNEEDIIFECWHEPSQHWSCFFFKQIARPYRPYMGRMDAEL
jgi:hypothetical protein